jgi:hypothetical protein
MYNGDKVNTVTLASTGTPVTAIVGNYPIVPSAAVGTGLSNYTITYTNGSLAVNKAALTITPIDSHKLYGSLFVFTGKEFQTSGLLVNDKVNSVSLSSEATQVTAGVGVYEISILDVAGDGLSNYNIDYGKGTFEVYKLKLVVTADDKHILWGDNIPVLTYKLSGFVNGEDSTSLASLPQISTTATTDSKPGLYPISVSGGSDENYAFSYVYGSLSIDSIPSIRILPAFQGKTLETMYLPIGCESIPSADKYIWTFTDSQGAVTKDSSATEELIPGTIGLKFAAKYKVSVSVKYGTHYSVIKKVDSIFTPQVPRTALGSTYRGITLTSMDQLIYAQYKTGATQYEFEFTNKKTGEVITRLNKNHSIAMKSVPGAILATTYSVRIRPVYYKSYGGYGAAFNITTPTTIPTTALKTEWRGATISSLSTIVWGTEVKGATDFEWQFTEVGTANVFTRNSGKTYNVVKLSMVAGIQPGKTYEVRIRAIAGTTLGEYGQTYTITTAPVMTKSVVEQESVVAQETTIEDVVVTHESVKTMKLFPTVSSTSVTIEAPGVEGGYSVTIVNTRGYIVATVPMNESSMIIDISNLGTGTHFVTLTKGGTVVKQMEFVKE